MYTFRFYLVILFKLLQATLVQNVYVYNYMDYGNLEIHNNDNKLQAL